MATEFKSNKSFKGKGAQVIFRFIEDFQEQFCVKIQKYAKQKLAELDNYGFEQAFYYGEQRTKTFVTASLDSVCGSIVLQEYAVERKKPTSKAKIKMGKGKLDYWCRYGNVTKISILMEVKQSWIRYYSPKRWTVHASGIKRHEIAVKQIKDIEDKTSYTTDNLYGLAMTIFPIYTRYRSSEDEPVKLTEGVLKPIAEDARIKAKAHAYGAFALPKEISPIDTWDGDHNQSIHESHPGIVFLWSVNKFTRG